MRFLAGSGDGNGKAEYSTHLRTQTAGQVRVKVRGGGAKVGCRVRVLDITPGRPRWEVEYWVSAVLSRSRQSVLVAARLLARVLYYTIHSLC
jgi:hypothetical protein